MSDRRVKVNLDLDASGYEAGAKRAKGATDQLGDSVDKTKQKNEQSQTSMQKLTGFVRDNDQAMQTAGKAITTVGIGLTALSVGATKAAIDWESSWADVQKVNDGTHEQMTRLEDDLREMARTIPATHEEIAAVAEAAGRLGVGVDDVADFSRVMIDLGNTTDLSADQAATAIARFSNIAGTSFSDADRLGSTIVDLGNNFATTESEIVEMSQRLAAAGSQAGLSEGEIMGLATAMSSVGIEAQAGGTAMTQTFNEIDAAVREGGDSLEGWAELAGTSAAEFADAWRNDPAEAVDLVIQGLAGINESGGDVAGTLDDLGISGIRQADVMRRLASASEVAGDAMAMGNDAFAENSALSEEAAIRYETTAMKIKTAWASVQDMFITAGAAIAPAVGDIADMVGDLADTFAGLPDPVLQSITAISGIAGVSAIAAGGLLILAPRAVETWDAFKRLRASSRGLPRFITGVGKAAGAAAVGFVAMQAVAAVLPDALEDIGDAADFETQLRLLTDGSIEASGAFDGLFDSSARLGDGLPWQEIDDLEGAISNVSMSGLELLANFDDIDEMGKRLLPGFESDRAKDTAAIENMDEAMASLANSGDFDTAAEGFKAAADAGEAQGKTIEEIADLYPEYISALREAASQEGINLEGTELYEAALGNLPPALTDAKDAADDAAQQDALVGALEDVGVAADGTVDSLSEYLDLLFETGLAEQSAMQAQASYQEALDGVSDAVDQIAESQGEMGNILNEAKDGFDVTSEAGRTAQAAFIDVASSGMDMATAMAEAGESQETIQEGLQGTYDDLISTAGEFGITGDAAEELARNVLGIPDGVDIETWMDETAQQTADELSSSLDEIPEGLTIITDMDESARNEAFETAAAIDEIDEYKKVDVAISEDGTAGQVQSKVDSITGKTEYVFVDEDGTTTKVQQQIINIDGVTRHVYVDDNGTIYATQSEINAVQDGSAAIDVDDYGTATGVQNKINNIKGRAVDVLVNYKKGSTVGIGGALAGIQHGGRAPSAGLAGLDGGGRLPYTGLGTDKILGINSDGVPLAMVDDLEWVINRSSSDKYDGLLNRVNQDHPSVHHLAHLNNGGRASGREWTASSLSPAQQIDYQRLAQALRGRENVEQHMHLHTANATITDGIDGFNRMNMAESRR